MKTILVAGLGALALLALPPMASADWKIHYNCPSSGCRAAYGNQVSTGSFATEAACKAVLAKERSGLPTTAKCQWTDGPAAGNASSGGGSTAVQLGTLLGGSSPVTQVLGGFAGLMISEGWKGMQSDKAANDKAAADRAAAEEAARQAAALAAQREREEQEQRRQRTADTLLATMRDVGAPADLQLRLGDRPALLRGPDDAVRLRDSMATGIFVPFPDIPGWVVQARGGEQALRYVDAQTMAVMACENPIAKQAATQQLDVLRRKAQILVGYDELINDQKATRMQDIPELDRLAAAAASKRDDILMFSHQSANSAGLAAETLRREAERMLPTGGPDALEEARTLQQVASLMIDTGKLADSKTTSADMFLAATKRAAALSVEWSKRVALASGDAGAIVRAPELAARRSMQLQVLFYLNGLALKTADAMSLSADTKEIADRQGAAALDSKERQKKRAEYDDQYRAERGKFESILKACTP